MVQFPGLDLSSGADASYEAVKGFGNGSIGLETIALLFLLHRKWRPQAYQNANEVTLKVLGNNINGKNTPLTNCQARILSGQSPTKKRIVRWMYRLIEELSGEGRTIGNVKLEQDRLEATFVADSSEHSSRSKQFAVVYSAMAHQLAESFWSAPTDANALNATANPAHWTVRTLIALQLMTGLKVNFCQKNATVSGALNFILEAKSITLVLRP